MRQNTRKMPHLWIFITSLTLYAGITLGVSTNGQNDTNSEPISETNDESPKLTLDEHSILSNSEKQVLVDQNFSDQKHNTFENITKDPNEDHNIELLVSNASDATRVNDHHSSDENDVNLNVEIIANHSSTSNANEAFSVERNVGELPSSKQDILEIDSDESNANSGSRGDGNIGDSNEKNNVEVEKANDSYIETRVDGSVVKTNDSNDEENWPTVKVAVIENYSDTAKRGDTEPVINDYEEIPDEKVNDRPETPSNISDVKIAASSSPGAAEAGLSLQSVTLSPSTISWLDAFLFQHRDYLWILFNTFFMVTWIIVSIFVLYRLFGLAWCSPHVSRTHYLIIHMLIFTTAAFEFVKLVHLSYGSHQGLPLFLILLLTHTPTPCLASSLILMIHCIFVSARVPLFNKYLPSFLHVSILVSILILYSFLGDIIIGVSHNSAFLLAHRVLALTVSLFCFFTFIFNYRKIVNIGQLMRREFRGELKSLAIPVSNHDESHEAKIHLKGILILWALITLVSCIAGIFMCVFSFCLSIFFTVSYVPIWAFWFIHSSIFFSQIILVLSLTFAAALTLVHTTEQNVVYKYFVPFLPKQSSPNSSIIKHGNYLYQRVALSNGTSNVPRISVTPIVVENEEQDLMPNNLVTELSTPPPFKTKVNLRRSATFNCAPPQHTYYGMPLPQCSTPIYPVLSEHLLPQSNSQIIQNSNQVLTSFGGNNSSIYEGKMGSPIGKSSFDEDCEIPYGYVSPSKRYYGYGRDRFSSLRKVPYSSRCIRPEISSPINQTGLEGALQTLEIPMLPCNNTPIQAMPVSTSINSRYGEITGSSFNASTPKLKAEPPEKPLRKTEPVLVKSVLKDNGTLESTLIVTPISSPMSYSTKRDPNYCLGEARPENLSSKFSPKPYRSIYDKNITPIVSPKKSINKNVPEDFPLLNGNGKDCEPSSAEFHTFSKAASPVGSVNISPVLTNSGPSDRLNMPSDSSTDNLVPLSKSIVNCSKANYRPSSDLVNRPPTTNPVRGMSYQSAVLSKLDQSNQKVNGLISSSNQSADIKSLTDYSVDNNSIQSVEYVPLNSKSSISSQSNETLNGYTDLETDNGSNSTLKDSTSSLSNVDASALPNEKKSTLKRNNSAAGYIPSRNGDENISASSSPTQDSKQQWYGTWGGRKHKRKEANSSTEAAAGGLQFGRQLKKLPGSKGSLSSLVGRLKPKRSKSLYQASHSKTSGEFSSAADCNYEQDDSKSLDNYIDTPSQVEVEDEDDMFLPRVTEELDLETEILKSSSMLANFYSLKRSDLKNKKQVDQTDNTNGLEWDIEEKCKFINDCPIDSNVVMT